MFGFRSVLSSRPHRSLVAAENALAAQARTQPDGWGIGWFDQEDAQVVRSASAAHACQHFLRASQRLESHTFLVHLRKATVGSAHALNAHPFRSGSWLFCHNGTLHGFRQLQPWMISDTPAELARRVLGETDSEHLFYWLLGRLERAGIDPRGRQPADSDQVAALVRQALLDLDQRASQEGLPRPLLNVLLTDGRLLFAHRAGLPLHASSQKRFCPDVFDCPAPHRGCLRAQPAPDRPVNHLLVASEPIAQRENHWWELSDGESLLLDERFSLRRMAPPPGWTPPPLAPASAPGDASCSSPW
jgi:glutamine amidotransferase